MDLSSIISISGRPGLFKVIARSKNNIIVESLIDQKRIPAYSTDRISALEDISIYTHEDDVPLKEVYTKIAEKEDCKECISHKESLNKLTAYLQEILPEYDEERVYPSDIKKLFQWYNVLQKAGFITLEEVKEEKPEKKEAKPKAEVKKKPTSTKPAEKKTTASKSTTKKAAPKKTTTAKKAVKK